MKQYCKAYLLDALRQFPGWSEPAESEGGSLSDEDVCFVWDDFTVQIHSPFPESKYIVEQVTPEWQAFCEQTLEFSIPDDLKHAYEDTVEQPA
jgi:hypothetical protein